MEKKLFHNSHDPSYRKPFGAVPCGTQVTLSLKVAAASGVKRVFLRLWREKEGMEERIEMYPAGTLYRTTFRTPQKPGLLWYYFIAQADDKEYYYGCSEAGGGPGVMQETVPPSYQITVYREGAEAAPAWFRDGVLYQIFVDRFYNGSPDAKVLNPRHNSMLHARWDNTPYYIRDPRSGRVARWDFFGGNLPGVREKLPYLRHLGIRAIYFNPIFASPSNHKYDTADYHNIDPMFGDNSCFKALCDEAARMGISIILDGVFSHTGSDSIYFNKEGNYNTPGAWQSTDSPYYPWYRFRRYPDDYECWWGIETLPNVNELEPSYREFIISGENSVLRHWHSLGIKGWRLDVADELPGAFVQELRRALKELDPRAVLMGEVWEDASNKISYGERRDYLLGVELDSVTNYPLRRLMLEFILGRTDAEQMQQAVMNLYENYPPQHFYSAVNMTGSHDCPRLLTELVADLPGDLPAEQQEALKLTRLKLFVLWQMTFPGVPCVYYGDETGIMEGGPDPENRGPYPWGLENEEIREHFQTMIALRNHYDVLRSGTWEALHASGGAYAYLRAIEGGRDLFGQEKQDNVAVVLLNRDREQEAVFDLDLSPWCEGTLVDPLDDYSEIPLQGNRLQISLGPLQGRLLLRDRWGANRQARRESGILLHPTSLSSPGGIGDLGAEAYRFIDFLEESGQSYWQVLPLNPPAAGNSPYQCFSAFAGNPLLIDLRKLVEEGLLRQRELESLPQQSDGSVDFASVKAQKGKLLRRAFSRFSEDDPAFRDFCAAHEEWLADFAHFMALKKHFGGRPWNQWEKGAAFRRGETLAHYAELLAAEISCQKFLQFIFFRQWLDLKNYAHAHGVKIIGDLPLFVAHDSSDVWSRPHLFALNEEGNPLCMAGVPPDYFSETGQLWGNPHYRWDIMEKEGYRWWKDRLRVLIELVDLVRIDHFLGLEQYWEIPAGEETAEKGRWVKGPGEKLFKSLREELGELPLIAEDLGLITPEVRALKLRLGIPGMNVLQFMMEPQLEGGLKLPLQERDTVLYTGTHDNNTLLGWYRSGGKEIKPGEEEATEKTARQERVQDRGEAAVTVDTEGQEICRYFIDTAMRSDAALVIIPLQDILFLDGSARMNTPGTVEGNWGWRLRGEELTGAVARELRELSEKHHRLSK
ncbi:MAG: bifunctional glycogen debranching protein GlgX/4-alpha-glucanotransferase [Bacillota bacterium]